MKKSGNQDISAEFSVLTSLEISEQEHALLQEPSPSPLNDNEKRRCVILPNHIISKDGYCSHYHKCSHRDDDLCFGKSERPILKLTEVKNMAGKKKLRADVGDASGVPETPATGETPPAPETHPEPVKANFPVKATINKYGFMHFGKDVYTALGLTRGADHDAEILSADIPNKTVTVKIPDIKDA